MKRLTQKDHIAFRMLAVCGNASTKALQASGVSLSRIHCYRKKGLIAQISYQQTRSQKSLNVAWGLTIKGRRFINKRYRTSIKSSVNAVRHNVAVGNVYAQILTLENVNPYNILSECEVKTIVEERILYDTITRPIERIMREAMLKSKELSMPDITHITDSGEIVCYEVETKSYSQEKIEAKRKTAEILGATYISIKI